MAGGYWWYITVLVRGDGITVEENEEILYSAAEISGSIGTEVQELPNGVRMRIYYLSDEDLSHWRNRLLDALAPWPNVRIEDAGKIENQPWTRQSEDSFPPLAIGDGLVVLAPWHRGSEPGDRIPIYINPGSAFGTGYHESTQVALILLERHLFARTGKTPAEIGRVVDIGTGSGILTIAAIKLGALSALARDLDPAAIDEARGNFELNGVSPDKVTIESGSLLSGVEGPFDILFSNILLDPLMEMLPDVRTVLRPDGVAIFSGMTGNEREKFLWAMSEVGLTVLDETAREEWWGVLAQNPA
ncbi:MAG: 50S ribosomal protein L11 methyltransferase [Synergistaceae bacterium]|jgi:ribosomal protein L11 methyltransferase|nr:50S ribosomal protein L11 methyltransferase [Synergistaceae bacterium]